MRRRSQKSRKLRRRKSRRKSRRKKSHKRRKSQRKFGVEIFDELGKTIHETAEHAKIEFLKKIEFKLEQVKKKKFTYGMYSLFVIILILNSYEEILSSYYKNISNKSLYELCIAVFIYVIGTGSPIMQLNAGYDLYNKIRRINWRDMGFGDTEYENIIENYNKLMEQKLIDRNMQLLFEKWKNYYIEDEMQNASLDEFILDKDHMNLVILLNTEYPEMKNELPPEYITDMCNKLHNFIKDYGEAYDRLDNEIINPLILQLMNKPTIPMSAIFLVGSPGTGKTRFVKNLSKSINADIYEYKKDKITEGKATLIEKDKDKFSVFFNMAYDRKNAEKQGKKPIQILFIDEFDKKLTKDKHLLHDLLQLLGDSDEKKITDKTLGIDVKVETNLIICASNKSLEQIAQTDSSYEPLISRFVEIFIPDMTKELQEKLIIEYVNSKFKQISEKTGDKTFVMTEDAKEFIKEVVYKTNFPGLRELQSIVNTYVSHLQGIKDLQKYKPVDSPNKYQQKVLRLLDKQRQEEIDKAAKEINTKTSTAIIPSKEWKKNEGYWGDQESDQESNQEED